MTRIVVVGSINLDLFAHAHRHPAPGETLIGTHLRRAPGGKGANQALAAALMGAPVALVGAVGEDADAAAALELLVEGGVDLTKVRKVAGTNTGLALITVSDDGENTIVVIPGANATVTPAQVSEALADYKKGDILILQGELPREATEAAVREGQRLGLRVVLNVAPWMELDRQVLCAADPLVLNEHEARLAVASLDGASAPEENAAALGSVNEQALVERLLSEGLASVIVTLGARGALVGQAGNVEHLPAEPAEPVDTTGAGDAFVGALCARLAGGDDLAAATRFAARVGARVVERPGAQPSYPHLSEMES